MSTDFVFARIRAAFVPLNLFGRHLLERCQSMARQNRRDIFDPNEVGAFHAVQRTVRRAWLCGLDPVGTDHGTRWIVGRVMVRLGKAIR